MEAVIPIKIKKKFRFRATKVAPYMFLAPCIITYFMFVAFPMIFTFYIGLTEWDGFGTLSYSGFSNYLRMFNFTKDPRLFQTFFNTFILMLMTMPASMLLSLFICFIMHHVLTKRTQMFRTFYYLPRIMTPVAIGIIFSILFDYNEGVINKILLNLGMANPINFMGTFWGARITLSILMIWSGFGGTILFMSAGLSTVSRDIIEAATIDGAGPLKTFIRISLPNISNVMAFIILTSMIGGFQMFDAPVMLFSSGPSGGLPYGGPGRSSLTMMMLIYDEAFSGMHYGYGAALSYGMFVFIIICTYASRLIMKRRSKNDEA